MILSDVPLEAKALEDQFERIKLADAGKLHAFEITLNAEGKPISTAFRDNGFKKASPSGLSSADVFTKKVFDGKTVEGTYKSAKESEFFGETYSFDVAFKAPITRAVAPRSALGRRDGRRAEEPAGQGVRRVPQGRPEGGPRGAQEARLLRRSGEAARPAGREGHAQDDQDDVRDGHPGPESRQTADAADLTVTGKQEERHRERRRPHGPGRRRLEAPARGVEELDRKIRSMHISAFLATRFLSGSRRGLPKTVSLLALFGVALGAASLVVAMGLMSGYPPRPRRAHRGHERPEVIAMPEPGTAPEEVRRALANPAERRRRRAHGLRARPRPVGRVHRRAPTPS